MDIKHKKGQVWNKPLTKEMEQFEQLTGKNAIYKGKITGQFEYWIYQKEKLKQKNLSLELKFDDYRKVLVEHVGPDMDIDYKKIKIKHQLIDLIEHKQINPRYIPHKLIIRNRIILKKKFGNSIKLYKGVSTLLYEKKGASKLKLNSIIKGISKGSVSWTNDKEIATNWASDGYNGYLIEVNIPINKILLSYYGSFILWDAGEQEFIVLPFHIKKFIITKMK